jgi:pyruvate/2-oxoglutarate dehydrogenase complex dihydrolipoamide dehydrogenase (E3) component
MAKISAETSGKNGEPETFDLVILGSGAGGKLAAWTYGKQGKRVAVIERKYIGVAGLSVI